MLCSVACTHSWTQRKRRTAIDFGGDRGGSCEKGKGSRSEHTNDNNATTPLILLLVLQKSYVWKLIGAAAYFTAHVVLSTTLSVLIIAHGAQLCSLLSENLELRCPPGVLSSSGPSPTPQFLACPPPFISPDALTSLATQDIPASLYTDPLWPQAPTAPTSSLPQIMPAPSRLRSGVLPSQSQSRNSPTMAPAQLEYTVVTAQQPFATLLTASPFTCPTPE